MYEMSSLVCMTRKSKAHVSKVKSTCVGDPDLPFKHIVVAGSLDKSIVRLVKISNPSWIMVAHRKVKISNPSWIMVAHRKVSQD